MPSGHMISIKERKLAAAAQIADTARIAAAAAAVAAAPESVACTDGALVCAEMRSMMAHNRFESEHRPRMMTSGSRFLGLHILGDHQVWRPQSRPRLLTALAKSHPPARVKRISIPTNGVHSHLCVLSTDQSNSLIKRRSCITHHVTTHVK